MKLSEKIQEALREQQEINLSDPAVQKRLAAQWGYVPAGAHPAPSIKDAIIDDLQSQFDSEGITEHDSGGALIRLSAAIAAVEDNFVQSAPSVPDGWKLVPIEPTQEMINRVIDERLDALAAGKDHTFIDIYKTMLAAAPKPEAKP